MSKIKITKEIEELVCKDWIDLSISQKQIEEKYNISGGSIYCIRKKYNLPVRRSLGRDHLYQYQINENYFENIDTPDKAYFLGFITADGYIRLRNNGKTQILRIELNIQDQEILEKFKLFTNSTYKINSHVRKREHKEYESCYYEVYREKFVRDLIKLGLTSEKGKILTLPKISDQLIVHYIRGLFDGDGSWVLRSTRDDIIFAIHSPVYEYLYSVQKIIMNKCNVNEIKIQPNKYDSCYGLVYGGNLQAKKFYDWIYGSGGPWLDRKFERSTEFFQKIELLKESDIPKENLPFKFQNLTESEEENIEKEQLESPKKFSILNFIK